jgi:hypothetical protein
MGGKDQDKLFWTLTFDVTESIPDRGNLADEGTPLEKPATRSLRRVLSPQNVDWLLGDVRQLGFEGKDLRQLDPDNPNAFDFGGKQFVARCVYKDYQDKTYEEWRIEKQSKKADTSTIAAAIAEMQEALTGDALDKGDNDPF